VKAHRTDGVSLTFALIFLAIAAIWLTAQVVDLTLPTVGWLLAGSLIVLGALGLLGALRSSRAGSPSNGEPGEAPGENPDGEPSAIPADPGDDDLRG
jgi:hypothetical protein